MLSSRRIPLLCAIVLLTLGVGLAVAGHPGAAAFDAVLAGITLGVSWFLRSPADLRFAGWLAIAGLTLHWLIIAVLQAVLAARGHSPFVVPDETGYNQFARELSAHWQGGPAVPMAHRYLASPFSDAVAGAYLLGGQTNFAGLAVPVAFGTWIPLLAHRIMLLRPEGGSVSAARIAGIITLLYPPTLMWSCLLLKDSSVTFAATALFVLILGLAEARRSRRLWALSLLGIALCTAWLIGVRAVQLAPVLGGLVLLGLWLAAKSRLRGWLSVLALLAVVAGVVLAVPSLRTRLDRVPVTAAQHRVAGRAGARTAEGPEANPNRATWGSTAEHVPSGLALSLLRPYPNEAKGGSEIAGVAGNLLYVLLSLLALAGAVAAWRTRRPLVLLSIGTILAMWLLLAVTEGNAGTAWRHRDAVTPLLCCLAAFALTGESIAGLLRRPHFARIRPRSRVTIPS